MNTSAYLLAVIAACLSSLVHGFAPMPMPTTSTQLFFQPQQQEEADNPSFKVTTLKLSSPLESEKGSKPFLANVQERAVNLLVKSYELDRHQYGTN